MEEIKKVPEIRFGGFEEEWLICSAEKLCSISTGDSNTQDRIANGKYPFYVRSATIEKSNRYLFDEEAVLTIGDGVGTGKVYHYVNGKYDLHQRVYRMYNFENINAKYFYYFFSENFGKRVLAMTAKSSVDSVRKEMIEKMDIVYPDTLDEQKLISDFFQNLDNLIKNHNTQLKKLTQLKKAMLVKLFPQDGATTPAIRFKGFDGDWEEIPFKNIGICKRGLTYSPTDVSKKGVKVLRSSNIFEDTFIEKEDDVYVNENAINIDYILEGDILVTAANGSSRLVGKHAIIKNLKVPAVHGGFMIAIQSDQPRFLNASMSSSWYYKFLNQNVAGGNGAIGNLKASILEEYRILVPNIQEQKKIGDYFGNLDDLIQNHKEQLKKLNQIKKACLSKLFVTQD